MISRRRLTPFPVSDLNNLAVADHLFEFLGSKGLD